MLLHVQFLCIIILNFNHFYRAGAQENLETSADYTLEDESIGFSVDSPLTNGRVILEVKNKNNFNVDKNGYVAYCPCMGRFGNQAEQFLGAMAFAKGLDRTLILPPWITYPTKKPFQSNQIQFTRWFKEEPLHGYHRVITMERFMELLAEQVWPKEDRIGFCYSFRDKKKCSMKEGNPFGPFWNHFDIDFVSYKDHPDLLWHTYEEAEAQRWNAKFPPNDFPVLAFQGAPGEFPSALHNQIVQKFISFSDHINKEADSFIQKTMKNVSYVGIHLRNGLDVKHVCDEFLAEGMQSFFASTQCTGHNFERNLTYDMCYPSEKVVIKQVKEIVKKHKLKAVFVGTDNNSMVKELTQALNKHKVKVYHRSGTNEDDDPIIDIAIMVKANQFIGNCISTFSAFIRRQRQVQSRPVQFFGL